MNLKQVGGDIDYKNYGGIFATKKFNNRDFDYWLFIELINMEEATGDTDTEKYVITISAVSPSEVDLKTKQDALYCLGLEEMNNEISTIKPFDMAKILNEYEIRATLFNFGGNNANKLFKIAREEIERINLLFGFYMNSKQNMIGNTGWDFIKGKIGFKD